MSSIPRPFAEQRYVYKPTEGEVEVRLPFTKEAKKSLEFGIREGARKKTSVRFVEEVDAWVIPRSKFHAAVSYLVRMHGEATVYLAFLPDQGCNAACMEAEKDECVCGCQGVNHAGGTGVVTKWTPSKSKQFGEVLVNRYKVYPFNLGRWLA